MNGNLLEGVLKLSAEVHKDDDIYDAVTAVKDYILTFDYLTQNSSLQRIRAYIACEFNYGKTLEKLAEEGVVTTRDAIKTSVWYANRVLKEKLGEDIMHLIQTSPGDVYRRLYMAKTGVEEILMEEMVSALPEFKYQRYDMEDCVGELLVLAHFSKSSFEYLMSKTNPQKVAYLHHLLTHPSTEELPLAMALVKWLQTVKKSAKSYAEEFVKFVSDNGLE